VRVLSVKLSEELFLDISREANKRNVSRSEVVRERLATGKPVATSLWDRMEDLVIQDESLPEDLSTDKRHLKRYGQNRTR